MDRVVEFGDRRFEWQWWSGQRLSGSADAPIAIDTETELICDPLHRPRIALAMAFDGRRLVAIHPSKVGEFLWQHRREHFVFHNAAFDFGVLCSLLSDQPQRQRLLWDAGDDGRLHCSLVLDMLLQLATGNYYKGEFAGKGTDKKMYPRNLAKACELFGIEGVDKADPFRLRFAELLDLSQDEMDAHPEFVGGFAAYALGDVIATHSLYQKQRAKAIELMRAVGWSEKPSVRYEIRHDALARWGPLTERIQVCAAIALDYLSRTPLYVDQEQRAALEADVRAEFERHGESLAAAVPGLFKEYSGRSKKAGERKVTKKSGVVQMDQKKLREALVAESVRLGVTAPISKGKQQLVSVSTKDWRKYADRSPLVAAWCEWERIATLVGFLRSIANEKVYSKYNLLLRTGRTSAQQYADGEVYSMNAQQMPKDERLRYLIKPPPGQKFVKVDYAFIELRTLAALVASRYGESKLKEAVIDCTLHGGLDPHQRTAARMLGLSEAEYLLLPEKQQKKARQDAKAVNFGLPGGLGVETLILYAKATYDVDLTKSSAKAAKAAWLAVYPEMKSWLGDRTVEGVRYQLGAAAARIVERAAWWRRKAATDWLRGADQTEREAEAGRDLIECVCRVAKRPDLVAAVLNDERTPELKRIVQYRAVTLTGRIRANTNFTDGANTPFQGLASDGAKIALWRLLRAGYTTVAFVHDEVLVTVDEAKAKTALAKVQQVMNDAMNEVLDGVPSATEGHVADCWVK